MSSPLADLFVNPYSSPQSEPIVAEVVQQPEKPGSLGIIFGGFILLLVGYLASNLLAIADLYGLGMGPDGAKTPSPLASVFTSPGQQWGFYVVSGCAFVGGAVMLGSQRMNPMAMVCYVMCPIAGLAFAVGWPLRTIKKFSDGLATVYLLVGSSMAFTGGTRLFLLYGNSNGSFEPVLASLLTQVGVALMVGAMLKFSNGGSTPARQSLAAT